MGPELSVRLGLRLPIEPMRVFDHYVEGEADFSCYPFVKDPKDLAVRPEGKWLTAVLVDFATPGGWDLSIDHTWFETVVWPALVDRVAIGGPATAGLHLVGPLRPEPAGREHDSGSVGRRVQ